MGNDVALSRDGTTAIVGAVGDVTTNEDNGQAFIFEWNGSGWTQARSVSPDEQDTPGLLGNAVALSADGLTALVGVPAGARGGTAPIGTVYVLSAEGGEWTREARLTSAEERPGERFGLSAALSADGTTALVGANQFSQENPNEYLDGSAHVLERVDGTWEHRTRLTAEDSEDAHGFGLRAALSADGTTALLGASKESNENGEEAGAAYVFSGEGSDWGQQDKLVPEGGEEYNEFGSTVSLSGDGTTAMVGDQLDNTATGDSSGSVSVFAADGGAWTQQATVVPDTIEGNERFGDAVALTDDGTRALVGSGGGGSLGDIDVGSVHLLEADGDAWTQREQYTQFPNRTVNDSFGARVDISADGTVGLVGATRDGEQGLTSGAAWVLDLPDD
ncbi:hypothetical protein Hrd1104_00690 [Halorhabdus sp. CBA1104]|uniref:FG-GAP repeat protein n=1 Tax=Halorhabdus sp. CBA1104 TaxID=1380432 RepID=UPI0012B30970|nr:FG-GAP repeat protein [Halorhabdus sp. CBA1104]QGN05952.1 hypothetical protein Hrd1104_00690 [Halorhabdus sp. CBA1104]